MRLDGSLGGRPHPSRVSRWTPGHGEPASAVRRLSPRAPEEVPGMNYVELHIGDYEKATAHLTAIEDGIYGRLLRRYYDAEGPLVADLKARSEEHTSELQSLMRISSAVFCLQKKNNTYIRHIP